MTAFFCSDLMIKKYTPAGASSFKFKSCSSLNDLDRITRPTKSTIVIVDSL
jgi:uncharacterized radical SAM superfamily protein